MKLLQALQSQAVDFVVAGLHGRHPDMAQQLGPRGLEACRRDVAFHLEFLEGALLADETALFVDYATWVDTVLRSRNVPASHLGDSFEILGEYLGAHLPPAEAARAGGMLGAAVEALGDGRPPVTYSRLRVPALAGVPVYTELALHGSQQDALGVMSAAMRDGASLTQAAVRLVQPAMYEIGRLWQENRITVSQEHRATAISQTVLACAYLQGKFAPPVGRKAMFAGVAGNQHSLGLRMLSDGFETIGWEVAFLGADVPVVDLVRQVDVDRPEILCLSLALPGHLTIARQTTNRLRAELGNRCPTIWVGGQVTLTTERVWRAVHADGWAADALHALEQLAT